MGEIGSFAVPLISVAAVMGIAGAVATDVFSEHVTRAARVIAAFVIISLAIPALGSLDLPTLPAPDGEAVQGGYLEVTREAFEGGISEAVAERIGAEAEDVTVRVSGFALETVRAEAMTVILPRSAALTDVRSLSAWLKENFLSDGGRCEVVIDFG